MIWEIFRQDREHSNHEHVGSVDAATEQMALQQAQIQFARRISAVSLWAVRKDCISEITADEAVFDGNRDKPHRTAGEYGN